MLRERHNSKLSLVDDGGIAAFDTFRQASKVHGQRYANMKPVWTGRLDACKYDFDGPLLGSWFLKTLINMETAGHQDLQIGLYFSQQKPACELVETAYGRRRLAGNAGLYFVATLGQKVKMEERFQYVSLIPSPADRHYVAGGGFVFYGFRFLLLLDPSAKPETFKEHNQATGNQEIPLIHRPHHSDSQ